MVTNNIMMKFRDKADGDKARALLEGMMGRIDELLDVRVYMNIGDSPFIYDLLYVSTFKDLDGLDAYMTHPVHVGVKDQLDEIMDSMAMVTYE